jgi:CspA family cold shock protein
MKKGTVKFFNEAKGFGFIKEEGGQEFEIQQGKKGLNAVNVSLA